MTLGSVADQPGWRSARRAAAAAARFFEMSHLKPIHTVERDAR